MSEMPRIYGAPRIYRPEEFKDIEPKDGLEKSRIILAIEGSR
jgi:hypothetical protein